VGRKKPKRKAEGGPKATVAKSGRVAEPRRTSGTTTGPNGPNGPKSRSVPRLTSMVPVRFEPAVLEEIRRRADDDGRSVSAWIRRAVEFELKRDTAG
jgi:hypothetical protein